MLDVSCEFLVWSTVIYIIINYIYNILYVIIYINKHVALEGEGLMCLFCSLSFSPNQFNSMNIGGRNSNQTRQWKGTNFQLLPRTVVIFHLTSVDYHTKYTFFLSNLSGSNHFFCLNPSVSWFWFSRNQWLRGSHQIDGCIIRCFLPCFCLSRSLRKTCRLVSAKISSFGCCPSSLHIWINRPISILNMSHCLPAQKMVA